MNASDKPSTDAAAPQASEPSDLQGLHGYLIAEAAVSDRDGWPGAAAEMRRWARAVDTLALAAQAPAAESAPSERQERAAAWLVGEAADSELDAGLAESAPSEKLAGAEAPMDARSLLSCLLNLLENDEARRGGTWEPWIGRIEAWLASHAETVPQVPAGHAEALARRFHETYERLAPQFGYETRADTKAFNPTSANGKLMIAVCASMQAEASDAPSEPVAEVTREASGPDHCYTAPCVRWIAAGEYPALGTKLYATPQPALAARQAEPAQQDKKPCAKCGGAGVVDDGEIDCSEDGTPYLNGPVKCVKDCPVCTPPAAQQDKKGGAL